MKQEYKVCSSNTIDGLNEVVTKALSEGYCLYGNPVISGNYFGYQAVTKFVDKG